MKKTVILSALMFISMLISISAQDRKFIYAQFEISYTWTNNGVKLIADMGTPQEKIPTFDCNYLKDSDGNDKVFNTPMGAVNWLARDGWELGENCTGIDTTKFMMRKDVSGMSDAQINDFLSRYIIGPSNGKKYTPNKKKGSR